MSRAERCKNPWNGSCRNTDIELYILYKGSRLPICRRCWGKLAEKPIEWGESLSAKTFAASGRVGVGAGAD